MEVGPKPVLLSLGRRCLAGIGITEQPRLWLPSLCPGRSACQQMLESLAQLYKAGASVRWEGLEERNQAFSWRSRLCPNLPTYPFERQSHWFAPLKCEPMNEPPEEAADARIYRISWERKAWRPRPRVAAAARAEDDWLIVLAGGGQQLSRMSLSRAEACFLLNG